MALLAELIPITTFFVAYRVSGLYVATLITMAVAALQVMVAVLKKEPITLERWMNVALWLLAGAITFTFKSSEVIKVKPTIGYVIFATTFFLTPYRTGATAIERSLAPIFNISHVPSRTWSRINIAWIIFFCGMGLLNLVIAYNTDTDTWVYLKLFGPLIITLLLGSQLLYLFFFKNITFKS